MSWLTAGLTAGSALAGGLANRKSTSTSMPTLDPAYLALQGDLIKRITDLMADPSKGTEPLRLGLMESVNRRYKTLPGKLTTQLAQRGFAKSGQLGQGFKGLELARSGEIGDINTRIADLILGRETQSYDLASRLLAAGRGQTNTQSGNVLGGALGSGLETLTTLTTLDKILKGAGVGAAVGGAGATAGNLAGLPLAGAGSPELISSTLPVLPEVTGAGATGAVAGGGLAVPGGLAAGAGYAGAGMAAAYGISKLVQLATGGDWSNNVAEAYQKGELKDGDPVGLGQGWATLYWLQGKWATPNQYRQATGSYPPGFVPPTP